MSTKFKQVKLYYDRGLWDVSKVRDAVIKEWITSKEFKLITQQEY